MSAPAVLSVQELNRATLARQMLLERAADCDVPSAVERLAGMQAQEPKHPFIGLWTRLEGFSADALANALAQRAVVRATLMRSTLHLFSAADYAALRLALQPPMSVALRVLGARAENLDPEAVVSATRELLAGRPLTFDAIRVGLQERFPDVNNRALGYAARTLVPLVMVPDTAARWGFPRVCEFALAEEFLDGALASAAPEALVTRYLGAFGPAGAADVQAWSGIGGCKRVLDGMRGELAVFTDPRGRELFDLPGAPRPGADAPAPVRFLPEFDNLVLAYDDRTRVIADEHRPLVTTKNLRVKATFLVDGVVAGIWTLAVKRKVATLELQPFGKLAKRTREELTGDGEALARFTEPDAKSYDVTVAV
ncbi:MAG TPA: winged helix DNA-binding domain-containing protein [Solirubrobacteraceae bacterium]|nr:winged helix DNA-binding domain-containing protein [Solirubrobacteraceae bacterium]